MDSSIVKISDFDYDLPPALIAQTPIEPRDASRLLVIDRASGALEHWHFRDIGEYLRPGDLLMLCSDGLSGMVNDAAMETILLRSPDLADAARKLLDTANANGGIDNSTVILIRYEGA